MIKSLIRFESILSLGGISKQHFWGQGIKMLQNRSTKPSEAPTNHDPTNHRTDDRSFSPPWEQA